MLSSFATVLQQLLLPVVLLFVYDYCCTGEYSELEAIANTSTQH
jgi:hypothetical protein